MEDIARELSVSKSTVSKALNGAKDISKAMRQSVLEKAVELGYSRLLRQGDVPRLAVFITNMEYKKPEDFGYDIVVGFRKAAEPAGFWVDLIDLDAELQATMHYDEYMVMGNYSGALFLGLNWQDPWMRDFSSCKTPTVLYDNNIRGNPNVSYLGVDNTEGMQLAVDYLYELGHRTIGYLGSGSNAYIYQLRFLNFLQAIESHGLSVDRDLTGNTLHISDCLTQHLPRLLERGCTAIVCSHDMLANSVLNHCQELGLRVPEDISILGFDDLPLCQLTTPPLTTIRQDRSDLGKSAFFAITNQLNKVPLGTFLLHASLVQRGSCSRPAGSDG